MSVRVMGDGADGYRLLSEDNEIVGWIRGCALGIGGFNNEPDAVSAAIRSYGVLRAWLERQGLHPLPEVSHDPPRLVHDGAYRWILVGRVQVARLTVATPDDPNAGTHSFEIVLKRDVSEGMGIHAGLVALRAAHPAIDAADIAWTPRDKRGNNEQEGTRSTHSPTTHLHLEAR